jgi:isopenicillin N synthase-like dioxygenase
MSEPALSSVSSAVKLAALPIINIAPWLSDVDGHGIGRLSTSAALHAAVLEYGFFYLDISAYADPSEPEELIRLAREFFALPQEEKERIALRHQDGARGARHVLHAIQTDDLGLQAING